MKKELIEQDVQFDFEAWKARLDERDACILSTTVLNGNPSHYFLANDGRGNPKPFPLLSAYAQELFIGRMIRAATGEASACLVRGENFWFKCPACFTTHAYAFRGRACHSCSTSFDEQMNPTAPPPKPEPLRTGTLLSSYQMRVGQWMLECFGQEITSDRGVRNFRFLEESLELVQALGCTQAEAHQLVDYVYGRDQGDVNQEVGGVMVTLAALCLANGINLGYSAEAELGRVWQNIEKIRAKSAAKPMQSPLPVSEDFDDSDPGADEVPPLRPLPYAKYLQLQGLLLLAKSHEKEMDEIAQAVRKLVDEPEESSHCLDVVFGGETLEVLLEKLGLAVEEPESERGCLDNVA